MIQKWPDNQVAVNQVKMNQEECYRERNRNLQKSVPGESIVGGWRN